MCWHFKEKEKGQYEKRNKKNGIPDLVIYLLLVVNSARHEIRRNGFWITFGGGEITECSIKWYLSIKVALETLFLFVLEAENWNVVAVADTKRKKNFKSHLSHELGKNIFFNFTVNIHSFWTLIFRPLWFTSCRLFIFLYSTHVNGVKHTNIRKSKSKKIMKLLTLKRFFLK